LRATVTIVAALALYVLYLIVLRSGGTIA